MLNTYVANTLYDINLKKCTQKLTGILGKEKYCKIRFMTDYLPEDDILQLALLRMFSQDFGSQKAILSEALFNIDRLFQKLMFNKRSINTDLGNSIINHFVDEIEDDLFNELKKGK